MGEAKIRNRTSINGKMQTSYECLWQSYTATFHKIHSNLKSPRRQRQTDWEKHRKKRMKQAVDISKNVSVWLSEWTIDRLNRWWYDESACSGPFFISDTIQNSNIAKLPYWMESRAWWIWHRIRNYIWLNWRWESVWQQFKKCIQIYICCRQIPISYVDALQLKIKHRSLKRPECKPINVVHLLKQTN